MAVGVRKDPYLTFNFLVEIDGLVVGGFSEVSGLQAEVEVQDYREGGLNDFIHRLAGPVRYPANLVLKRGLTEVQTLWLWHRDVRRGIVNRRNLSILLLDATREIVAGWNVAQAYPVRWVGPEMRAEAATVAVETVELVHCGFVEL